jgi:hypothetical protein
MKTNKRTIEKLRKLKELVTKNKKDLHSMYAFFRSKGNDSSPYKLEDIDYIKDIIKLQNKTQKTEQKIYLLEHAEEEKG